MSNPKNNTFQTPDFAFPKTVDQNATVALDASLKSHNYQDAILAAIQIDIAQAMVSESTFKQSAERFDSIATLMPSPWQNLVYMLEAQMYSELYSARSYYFNNREIPPTPRPDNVEEWSRQMFEDQITELIDKALTNSKQLSDIPLSTVNRLLTDCHEVEHHRFSVLDFLQLKAVNIYAPFSRSYKSAGETIPFGPEGNQKTVSTQASLIDSWIDNAIERNRTNGNKYCEAFFCNMKLQRMDNNTKREYAGQCVDRFIDTPFCANFLSAYCKDKPTYDYYMENGALQDPTHTNETRLQHYRLLTDYKKRFPDAPGIGAVEQLIANYEEVRFNITVPEKILPGSVTKLRIDSQNIRKFYILVYSLPSAMLSEDVNKTKMVSQGKLYRSIEVTMPGVTAAQETDSLTLEPMAKGLYAVAVSTDGKASGIYTSYQNEPLRKITVSDITTFTVKNSEDWQNSMYVVSARDGKPLAGVRVKLMPRSYRQDNPEKPLVTDSQGKIPVPEGGYDYEINHNGSLLSGSVFSYFYSDREKARKWKGAVMTDLAIYRPGDTVEFSTVVWSEMNHELQSEPAQRVKLNLRDANFQIVDSLTLATDEYGRVNGKFRLPDSGMLGEWQIEMQAGSYIICTKSITVAEYKSPTFYIETKSADTAFVCGDTLKFNGMVKTYAGMPLPGAKVNYTIEYSPFRFFYFGFDTSGASYSGECVTDGDGAFEIDLETAGLKGTRYETGRFTLKIYATNAAGETQEATPLNFALGNEYIIKPNFAKKIEVDKPHIDLDVTVTDALDNKVNRTLYYRIQRDDKIVKTGEFPAGPLQLEASEFPSGDYKFEFAASPDFTKTDNCMPAVTFAVLWRRTDTKPAQESIIWIDDTRVIVDENRKQAKIRVGSSYPSSHILMSVSNSSGVLKTEWLEVNDGFVTVVIDRPAENERNFVTLIGVHDNKMESANITLIPREQTLPLKPEIVTFRDKLTTGDRETWRFRFTIDSKEMSALPVMAVMTNKALNAITPFEWRFNPSQSLYWSNCLQEGLSFFGWSSISGSMRKVHKFSNSLLFVSPEWQTYGHQLAGRMYGGPVYLKMARSERYALSGATAYNSVMMDDADTSIAPCMAEMAVVTDMAVAEESSIQTMYGEVIREESEAKDSSEPLREVECPLAFFMPSLVTDRDGVAVVEFEAPNFVGTWQLQVLGYTPDMKGAVLTLDAVSAKKVMVQMNAPRFARTGDRLSVSATVFNNSGESQPVDGRIEFINPLTGEVLQSFAPAAETLDDLKSRVITSDIKIPSNIEALQIRVFGNIPGYQDGEQIVIPILPSSTAVTESTPFYLQPGEQDYSIRLPKFQGDASVTLTYCDNPIWECVTALPDILNPDSESMLTIAYALFGNCIADGLLRKYPELIPAILTMASDSTLVSPLEKNPELKTVLLNNTPWVNNAKAETLRMQNLVKYVDPAEAKKAIDAIMTKITDRQNGDGGWSWCPEMKSSLFITECVFYVLGSLQNLGYLPAGADAVATRASNYIETEVLNIWKKSNHKYYPLSAMVDYMMSKTAFKDMPTVRGFEQLEKLTISDIRKDWRKFNIKDKATAAMLLDRKGFANDAKIILSSVLEFASESHDKGMWFDNMEGGYSGMKRIYDTTRVLEAFGSVEPTNPAVDRLRQWLVVSKQTMDWGDDRFTADAVNAILNSGTKWTVPEQAPVIEINGEPVALPRVDRMTGAFTVQLDTRTASDATLTVHRSGAGPAWGGVVAQFIAPIEEVKAASIPQLSIEKNVYAIAVADGRKIAENAPLKVGDKVKVTLTVTCDRDIEYVAVTDPRAACLEPADQVSRYTVSDGLWFYREVRNTQTNLFIPFLSKGTHVISYDCYVDREGEYALGPVNAQSQYAPTITAHSRGSIMEVE